MAKYIGENIGEISPKSARRAFDKMRASYQENPASPEDEEEKARILETDKYLFLITHLDINFNYQAQSIEIAYNKKYQKIYCETFNLKKEDCEADF